MGIPEILGEYCFHFLILFLEKCRQNWPKSKKEVRNMALAGLENIKEGKTENFNEVCDSLEKKYRIIAIQNQN